VITRTLGQTGIRVSVVGFGGMRFFNRDEAEAKATVRRCVEKGITFFETGSYGGGRSEEVLGKALWEVTRRDQVVLADKAAVADFPSAAAVRAAMEASLRRYRTDYFDVFNFWGTNTPEMHEHILRAGLLDEVLRAKEEGLVRAIGLTTHARPEWIRDFVEVYPWDCVVLKEHLLYSRNQELIAHLADRGIGVVVMTPLAGGVVAHPGAAIREMLTQAGTTPAVLGLRYLVANPGVSSAISGMTTPDEIDENVRAGAIEGPLTATELGLIDDIRRRTSALGERFCTSCGYCLPCPQEVNIPGIFRLWNLQRGYGNDAYSRLEYQKLCEQRHWADFPGASAEHCVECGLCETKCPEGLPIIADLKKAHADLTAPQS